MTAYNDDDDPECALSTLGKQECIITYKINAKSDNGTVAVQSEGKITVSSECMHIPHKLPVNDFWMLSSAGKAIQDPLIS